MAIINLSVPTSLDDIQLWQYQEYLKLGELDDVQYVNKKLIELFCGVSMDDVDSIPIVEVEKVLGVLKIAFEEEINLIKNFTLRDVEFGFIPKLDSISLGEYIDLENTITDWQSMHKAMAVLYRPVNFKKGDKYTIAPYSPNEEIEEIMKDMPLSVAKSAMVFFYRLGIQLSKATLRYTEVVLMKEENLELRTHLEKNGVGINQFMDSLKETYSNLTRLQN
ncbi:MAG: hypothetical protein CMJ25_10315 [Phycisphaerae bacterium]|mgnify:CR=1 FL=1|nr:hypothetical protein [Phycisphaerae bacterium]